MPSAAGGVIDRSVGHYAFRILPTVPQLTSTNFIPQITFLIPHFRKLPTPRLLHNDDSLTPCTGNWKGLRLVRYADFKQ